MTSVRLQKAQYTRRVLVTDFLAVVSAMTVAVILNFQDLLDAFGQNEAQGVLRVQLNPVSLAWVMGSVLAFGFETQRF